GFNDNARQRAIVMHGADYVSGDFIKSYGRLGRSFGCPSVSMDIYKDVIGTISDGSLLFIYSPDKNFLERSSVLNVTKTNRTA
ncbi:MAG: murein L,D-transpeptidase catalytic domain-containing protein, partial [Tangfeifania sp.]